MMINCQDITFGYCGCPILDHLSLNVPAENRGEKRSIITLIGPNGVGKTTLINILSGYINPQKDETGERGVLKVAGIDAANSTPSKMANIGVHRTWQGKGGLALERTVFENLFIGHAFGRRSSWWRLWRLPSEDDIDSIRVMLKTCACDYLIDRFDKPASSLSFGWRKLLEIVRLLFLRSKIVMLDEPLSGLDPEKILVMKHIIQMFRHHNIIVILVEHIRSQAHRQFIEDTSGRMLFMWKGKFLADGLPKDVLNRPEVIEASMGFSTQPQNRMTESKKIGSDAIVLSDFSVRFGSTIGFGPIDKLRIKQGFTVVVGPNGSGKSTLLEGIMNASGSRTGKVVLNGVETTSKKTYELSQTGIAMIPQIDGVFPDFTIVENMMLALGSCEKKGRIIEILKQFSALKDKMKVYARDLSGGERRRLALAMGLVRRPKILLCDELSIGLDISGFQEALDILEELVKNGVCVIAAEQNFRPMLNKSNKVIALSEGKIFYLGRSVDFTPSLQLELFTGRRKQNQQFANLEN